RPAGPAIQSTLPRAPLEAAALATRTAYGVQVCASSGGSDGPWSEPAPFTTLDLAAPADLTATAGSGEVRASWSATPDATGYELRVDDADGQRVAPAPRVAIDGTGARVDVSELGEHTYVELRVRATAQGAAGPWSAPAAVTLGASQPAPPAQAEASDQSGQPVAPAASESAADEPATDAPAAESGEAAAAGATPPSAADDGNPEGADPASGVPADAPGQNGATATPVGASAPAGAAGPDESTATVPEPPPPAAVPGVEAVPESSQDDGSYGAPVPTTAQEAPEAAEEPGNSTTVPDAEEVEEAVG
ncbi:MAG TPA: fibronectin type III domain-containing protein, partial [Longimicrobiaceae bacterium]|nr:fibronectin type III domain-containing protein [Longimicrobiaceae bacterium]